MFTEAVYRHGAQRRPISFGLIFNAVPPHAYITLTVAPQTHPVVLSSFSFGGDDTWFWLESVSIGNSVIATSRAALCGEFYVLVGQDIIVQARNTASVPRDFIMQAIGVEIIDETSIVLISEDCAGCGAALMHFRGKDAVCANCL